MQCFLFQLNSELNIFLYQLIAITLADLGSTWLDPAVVAFFLSTFSLTSSLLLAPTGALYVMVCFHTYQAIFSDFEHLCQCIYNWCHKSRMTNVKCQIVNVKCQISNNEEEKRLSNVDKVKPFVRAYLQSFSGHFYLLISTNLQ